MATTRDHQIVEQTEREPGRDAPESPQGPAARLLALQQLVGNAAVSRLVAGSRSLNRAPDGAPGNSAPDGAPGGGQDAMLSMTRVAWDTGVTQRERDAAKKLEKPRAQKGDFNDAWDQLGEAVTAAVQIGDQIGAVDPNRKVRANVHVNAIADARNFVLTLIRHVGPAEMGQQIETQTVPSSERAIADISAPLAPAAPGATPPAAPPAPTPAPGP